MVIKIRFEDFFFFFSFFLLFSTNTFCVDNNKIFFMVVHGCLSSANLFHPNSKIDSQPYASRMFRVTSF